jgi:hypothetical protein
MNVNLRCIEGRADRAVWCCLKVILSSFSDAHVNRLTTHAVYVYTCVCVSSNFQWDSLFFCLLQKKKKGRYRRRTEIGERGGIRPIDTGTRETRAASAVCPPSASVFPHWRVLSLSLSHSVVMDIKVSIIRVYRGEGRRRRRTLTQLCVCMTR